MLVLVDHSAAAGAAGHDSVPELFPKDKEHRNEHRNPVAKERHPD